MSPAGPLRRTIVLGASNVTRSLPIAVEAARRQAAGPLDLLVAGGHGRSYGLTSRVLCRTLPGILHCGLWDALADRPPAATTAIVTDVGNDLLYGVSPETVARWVETCLDRLAARADRLVLTALPLANLDRVSERFYRVFSRLLFPANRRTLTEIGQAARGLDELLAGLARRRAAVLVPQPAAWYGWDPLHHRRGCWPLVWQALLGAASAAPPDRGSLRRWWQVRTARPHRAWLAGYPIGRGQPARRWRDGSCLSLY